MLVKWRVIGYLLSCLFCVFRDVNAPFSLPLSFRTFLEHLYAPLYYNHICTFSCTYLGYVGRLSHLAFVLKFINTCNGKTNK